MTHIIRLRASQLVIDDIITGVHLTRHEENLLRAIFARKGLATYEFLLQTLYGGRDEPEMKIIAVFACKLRKKLGKHADAVITVWGRGFTRNENYALVDDGETSTVNVDGDLLAEVAFNASQTPDELIDRLLRAEKNRQWAEAA